MLTLTDVLYYFCFALLLGMAAFVWTKNPRSWLHASFALTALSLLAWLVTLFAFNRATEPSAVLWLGRANFAAVPFAVFFGYLFVRAVAGRSLPRRLPLLGGGTLLLGGLTLFTPFVDQSEIVGTAGKHVTQFGPLFLLYLAFVLAFLAAAVLFAFQSRQDAIQPARDQLLLVGSGILATGAVALVTNVVLPYGFSDFRLVDVGTLATILFLLAVAYAISVHHLFDIRLLVRKTLVYGLLLSFVLGAYTSVVLLVTQHLTAAGGNSGPFTQFGVLVIASSFDPLRRYLEKRVDRLLFPRIRQARPHPRSPVPLPNTKDDAQGSGSSAED